MFTLTLDTAQMIAELDDIRRNQLPFAMALAMNWTVIDVQEEFRTHVEKTFTIRNPTFMRRLIKIAPEDRAKKDRLSASIRIEGPRAKPDRGKVLTRHEEGGTKQRASQAPFFVPTQYLRPNKGQVISQRMYPAYLGVVTSRVGDSGRFREPKLSKVGERGTQHVRGLRGTFALSQGLGHRVTGKQEGIYQRIGPGRGSIVRIWKYQPSLTLEPSLNFQAIFDRVSKQRYNENFTDAMAFALDENRTVSARVWRAERVSRRSAGDSLP